MRFGSPIRSNPLGELVACRRTITITDYQDRFLALLTRAGPLTEAQQVQLFMAGLGEPLSIDVQLLGPQSLELAMSFARSYERREQLTAPPPRAGRLPFALARGLLMAPQPVTSTPSESTSAQPQGTSAAPAGTVTVAGRTVRRLSPSELDERHRNRQCFNCDEKYVRGHNRVCARLFVLEIDSNADNADAAGDDSEPAPQISLQAISGVRTRDTMQVHVQLGHITVTALLDSGSTHNFVSSAVAMSTGLCFIPRTDLAVTVANGDRVRCPRVFRDAAFSIEGDPFCADVYVLPLGVYDMVLGTDWLASLGPILWDFGRQTMSLWRSNRRVRWRGVPGPRGSQLHATQGPELLVLLLVEFADVFATPTGLPPPRARDHFIHLLSGTPPVAVRPYRYPQLQKDELERQCRAMEEQGLIRCSSSAFSAPVLLVKKSDGTWRLCVDYRALNERTVKDKFPILVVEELLDELHGARFFSKLDLRSGCHQVRMNSDDIAKTAFRTHDDLYEFLVMPFGLTNAPTMFQALMNDVLRPFLRQFVLVFFDILIYNASWAEHLGHIRAVLSALRRHQLFLKRSKCFSAETSVAYLGHVVSGQGVAMDTSKVQAILDWPTPSSVCALRGFLGLAGYYRRFIKEFGSIAAPLTHLLKKDAFQWSPTAESAFKAL